MLWDLRSDFSSLFDEFLDKLLSMFTRHHLIRHRIDLSVEQSIGMTRRTMDIDIHSLTCYTSQEEILFIRLILTLRTSKVDQCILDDASEKNILHTSIIMRVYLFCKYGRILSIDFSRQSIYASSNAHGENSSPESAMRSGQRI